MIDGTERFVVLGVSRVRSPWFVDVASWANAGIIPVEFVKCVSVAELVARLDDARATSALIVEAGVGGIDRDLIDTARSRGVATIVVTTTSAHEWRDLGAAAVLADRFDSTTFLDALTSVAAPVVTARHTPTVTGTDAAAMGRRGDVIAVVGSAGVGSTTVAMALAQGLGARQLGDVLLADFVRRGHLALYHDARDVIPGLQELVESHRTAQPDARALADLLFDVDERGYSLLLGLRRLRDWTAIRPRALEASLESLRALFDLVVIDADAESDGEAETGSADLEERNFTTRLALREAAVVVSVADASLKGIHDLVHLQRDLSEAGIDPRRVVTVVNRAPRSPRQRGELTRTIGSLGTLPQGFTPIFLPERRHLDVMHGTVAPVPSALSDPLTSAVLSVLRTAQPAAPMTIDTTNSATTALVSAT